MKKKLLHLLIFQFIGIALVTAQNNIPVGTIAPAPATPITVPGYSWPSEYYLRTIVPLLPVQDTGFVNIKTSADSVQVVTQYFDELQRPLEKVIKQASPLKKDLVILSAYDEFNRPAIQYLPYVAQTGNTGDGQFKYNPFEADSAFYKSLFATEDIYYARQQYDGSPLNRVTKTLAPGNSWGGAGIGTSAAWRANNDADSVVLWNMPISSEDDVPVKLGMYIAGSLALQEITDEKGIKQIIYTDEAGRTVLTKAQLAASPTSGHTGWICTYYIYDEMGRLRMVIPPKAVEQLVVSNWQLATDVMDGLCYSFYYDNRGLAIMKRIPGKGKSYIAYDLLDRPVMTQDPNLRQTNQWAFVLYDGQSRPIKSGTIISALTKDTIQAQAAASNSYPALSGTYTVMTETYYDDYDWIATTGAPINNALDANNINSSNFIMAYNTAPDYAQPLASSKRIRGAVTGAKINVLGTSSYSYTATFYDNNGRAIQTQQKNHTGGTDIATLQYSYKGTLLRSHLAHSKAGANAQTHTVLGKYTYDHVGRLLTLIKNIDGLGDKTITQYGYEETGQLKTKTLGAALQTQTYSYNIRGMLTAINAPYVTETASTGNEYFGEILSYTQGFTSNQNNGTIAGVRWKNAGDSTARAYGYAYDNAGRLTSADFSQQNSGSTAWTNDKIDYTVNGLSYDAGGNILTMNQRSLLGVGGNATIDSLAYTYFTNSNKLQKVTDLAPPFGGPGGLGDFTDSTNTGDDYTYDANGNIVKDNNRHLHNANGSIGTLFNLLDKPDSMTVAGRSCTYYKYDAAGILLSKTVKDYKNNTIKNYSYVSGFVYLNDTLQYAGMEEGRMRRCSLPSGGLGWAFDYFIKDHAGNIRTVLTDEVRTDIYPAATMDTTTAIRLNEEAVYSNLPLTRLTKPAAYPAADNYPIPNANNYVAKVQGNTGGQKIGPGIVLKVMKGDKFTFYVSSFYQRATAQPVQERPLNDIVTALINGISSNAVLNPKGITATQLQTAGAFTPGVTSFLDDQHQHEDDINPKPMAFVNWLLFDEQFNMVSSTSGFEQVNAQGVIETHVRQDLPVTQTGYLYIYVSNATPNIPVYFDNLKVSHTRSPVLETSEYYPYGLKMASISYKASMTMTNRYGWNGGNEYEDEGELNYSNTFYRKYDAQIGRFTGVDMLAEKFAGINPYQFGFNNPVMFNDPMGDQVQQQGTPQPRKRDMYDNWLASYYSLADGSGDWSNSGGGGGMSEFDFYSTYAGMKIRIDNFGNGDLKYVTNKWGDFGFRLTQWFDGELGKGRTMSEVKGTTTFTALYTLSGISGGNYDWGNAGNWTGAAGTTLEALENAVANKYWWRDAKGSYKSTKILQPGINGKFIRGVQGYRNGYNSALKAAGTYRTAGNIIGGIGLAVTVMQYSGGQISGIEATVDGIFGVIGFLGPIGAGVSTVYFLGKLGYEYFSDDTLFEKPQ